VDILAARKKAAEKTRAAKSEETLPAEPASEPSQPEGPAARAAASADPAPARQPEAPSVDRSSDPSEKKPVEVAGEEIEILAFRLGGEEYAVTVSDVREVLKIRELTLVPNAPDYILGVASLRGTMLPVIDLGKRLGLTPGVRDEKSRIVVVSPDEEDVGLMVDRVTGVLRIAPDAVKPAPENIEHGGEYLRGIVRKGDSLFILLDLAKAVGT
jgi:purine-binding chemotaxis protein CheW